MPKASDVYRAGNGTWYFKLRVGRDPLTGAWKQVTRRGFRTAADASEARRHLADSWAEAPPQAFGGVTVSELVQRYHEEERAMNRLSERTLFDQSGYRRNYIDATIGALDAADVTAVQIRAWLVKLATDGGAQGKPLSPNTIRLARSILLKAFAHGVATSVVPTNPVEQVKPPRLRKSIPAHWAPEDARRFLASFEGDRLYPLWAFVLSSGVRVSELVWLRWPSVDLDHGLARLNEFPTTIGYRLVPSAGKNNSAVRTIDLDRRLIGILRQQSEQQRLEREQPGYEVTDFVFTKPAGGNYHPQAISKRLVRESGALGLPRLSAHGLRHTCATLMLANGVPAKVAAERLGHADTRMFSNVYSHVTPTMQRDAADKFGDALFAPD
ncbi:MAG: site-specific integrase [Acidimicrobiia bacterium]|nr:site-specific integrase [Acidimicrobiia bacterium]MDH5289206.1 site-specific integrase [Acidimicrobiia bacterium]